MELFYLNACTVKLKTSTNPSATLYGHGVPKRVYVGNSTFKTAVAFSVISFNRLGIEPGYYTMEGCTTADLKRIKQSDRKSTDGVKARRKTLRAIRKGFNDKHELDEGDTYASGSF